VDLELGHGVDVGRLNVAAVVAVSMLATPSVMLLEFGRWPFTVKPLTDPTPGRRCSATARRLQRCEVEERPPVVGDVLQLRFRA
jgi:hypothetical protein